MTSEQIELVQNSFEKIRPNAEEVARLFYGRLFEVAPSLRPLFRGDMEEQGRKLMQMIAFAVGSLRRLEEILPAVEDLGRRHGGYGVRGEHYAVVGSSLMWTLETGLGEAFTPEVSAAWAAMYGVVAETMCKGASMAASA